MAFVLASGVLLWLNIDPEDEAASRTAAPSTARRLAMATPMPRDAHQRNSFIKSLRDLFLLIQVLLVELIPVTRQR